MRRDTPKLRRLLSRSAMLVAGTFLILVVAIWATVSQRSSVSHMHVVVQASDLLKIEFLQPDPISADHCQALANRVAETMRAKCTVCRVLVSRCLDKLDARQSNILRGQPVDMPVMRTPTGTVAFISDRPELADAACQESERQASGNLRVRCVAAGIASSAVSLTASNGNSGADVTSILNGTLTIILFAAVMSLVAVYLVRRARATATHIGSAVTSESSAPSHSIERSGGQFFKRSFDICLALVLLAILLPLWLLAALLILLFDGRPVFYISRRYISSSEAVPVFKFRTMVKDATDPKYQLNERFMRDGFLDIPISCEVYTPLGRFLERTQLVETPQLLNILLHGMSFVGNRPLPANNIAQLRTAFPGWIRRFDCPAGITGIAQVVGRRNVTAVERLELETLYARVYNCGNILKCDLRIILATIRVVVFARGITISQARTLLQECLEEQSNPAVAK